MKNKTWLIVTVCMLLASAVILTGCMVAIAQQEEPSKPYEMGEAVSAWAQRILKRSGFTLTGASSGSRS